MRPTGTEVDEFLLRLRDAEPEKRANITRIRNYIANLIKDGENVSTVEDMRRWLDIQSMAVLLKEPNFGSVSVECMLDVFGIKKSLRTTRRGKVASAIAGELGLTAEQEAKVAAILARWNVL